MKKALIILAVYLASAAIPWLIPPPPPVVELVEIHVPPNDPTASLRVRIYNRGKEDLVLWPGSTAVAGRVVFLGLRDRTTPPEMAGRWSVPGPVLIPKQGRLSTYLDIPMGDLIRWKTIEVSYEARDAATSKLGRLLLPIPRDRWRNRWNVEVPMALDEHQRKYSPLAPPPAPGT